MHRDNSSQDQDLNSNQEARKENCRQARPARGGLSVASLRFLGLL